MVDSFEKLTEAPGDNISTEQLRRLIHRYYLAGFCAGGCSVLEVGCGSGIGLNYLANIANSVDGCDIDHANIQKAKMYCRSLKNVSVQWADAQDLPYPDANYDLVLLYEAIYYLPDAAKFVAEARRVLKQDGRLIICTVNPQWKSFHPSPLAVRYFSTLDLYNLLLPLFRSVEIFGAFPANPPGMINKLIDIVKRCAIAFHLIPKTLHGRARLKRIIWGKLEKLPSVLKPQTNDLEKMVILEPSSHQTMFKILYAVADGSTMSERLSVVPHFSSNQPPVSD